MPDAPGSEQKPLTFAADEAIARIFGMLNSQYHKPGDAGRVCGQLWENLPVYKRLVWCHAACLDGGACLRSWPLFGSLTPLPQLSLDERTALLLALESMIDFFQQAGGAR